MMRRTITTVAAVSMLLVALFGGTALAQDAVDIGDDGVSAPNPEGYTDDQCAVAIAAYYRANFADWSDLNLTDENGDALEGDALTTAVADVLVDLTPVGDDPLTFEDICAIYAALPDPPDVLAEVEERPEPEPEEEPVVEEEVTPEVMGVTIARTGADTVVLGIIGALLMGLGFVAVRRTRTEHGLG